MGDNRVPNAIPYLQGGQLFSGSTVVPAPQVLAENKRISDEARRKECELRMDILEDDWQGVLRTKIIRSFEQENAKEILKVLDVSNNPSKRIIEDLSVIYNEPPTWEFDESVSDEAKEQWATILEEGVSDVVMPEVNRITNACNEAVLLVTPFEDRLKFQVTDPGNCIAWQDPEDPTRPIKLAVRIAMENTVNQAPHWVVYGQEEIVVLDGDPLDVKSNRIKPPVPNPYKDGNGRPVIPAVIYHRRHPRGRIWDSTSGRDVFELAVNLAMFETWINHLVRTDSIRQKYVSGKLDNRAVQTGGPTSFLEFRSVDGNPVSVGEFSSQADWGGLTNLMAHKLRSVLQNNGLSEADFRIQGNAQSGFSLRVQKEKLIELRKRQVPVYRVYDKERYRVTAAVWNAERENAAYQIEGVALPWAREARPNPVYADFHTVLTVQERKEQAELDEMHMEMGLESPITIYQRENPGATEEDARAALEKNKADTKALKRGGANPETGGIGAAVAPPPGAQPDLKTLLAQRVSAKLTEKENAANGSGPDGAGEGEQS